MKSLRTSPFKRNETITNETFVQHVYDLDMIKIYNDLSIALSHKEKVSSKIKKDDFLENIREKIMDYCAKHDFNYSYHLSTGNIVVSSDNPQYFYFLGLRLTYIEFNKIQALLEHHFLRYSDLNTSFCNLLDHSVYDVVKNNSPFLPEKARLNMISAWGNIKKAATNEVEVFKRIQLPITTEQAREYFMRMNRKNKKGQVCLTIDEIEYFLSANFEGFPYQKRTLLLEPNCIANDLWGFIGYFQETICNQKLSRENANKLLKYNFLKFIDKPLDRIDKKLYDYTEGRKAFLLDN
jgi:hypothetical protein